MLTRCVFVMIFSVLMVGTSSQADDCYVRQAVGLCCSEYTLDCGTYNCTVFSITRNDTVYDAVVSSPGWNSIPDTYAYCVARIPLTCQYGIEWCSFSPMPLTTTCESKAKPTGAKDCGVNP